MKKKLEEVLNLPSMDELNQLNEIMDEVDVGDQTILEKPAEIMNAITTAEKIDVALPTVEGLEQHDTEMDKIAKEAMDSYEELKELGMNSSDAHAGRILEVAALMLKTAMEAKDAKVNKKLKMIEMQLRRYRIEKMGIAEQEAPEGTILDRNELIKLITDTNKSKQNGK